MLHSRTVAGEAPGRVAVLAHELVFHCTQEIIGTGPGLHCPGRFDRRCGNEAQGRHSDKMEVRAMRHRPLISQLANVRNGSKADTSRRSHCYDLSFLRVAPVSVSASIGLRNAPSRNTCKNTKRPTDNRTNSRCRCDKSPSDRQFVECERCSNGKGQPVGSVDCAVRDPPFSTDKLVSSLTWDRRLPTRISSLCGRSHRRAHRARSRASTTGQLPRPDCPILSLARLSRSW